MFSVPLGDTLCLEASGGTKHSNGDGVGEEC